MLNSISVLHRRYYDQTPRINPRVLPKFLHARKLYSTYLATQLKNQNAMLLRCLQTTENARPSSVYKNLDEFADADIMAEYCMRRLHTCNAPVANVLKPSIEGASRSSSALSRNPTRPSSSITASASIYGGDRLAEEQQSSAFTCTPRDQLDLTASASHARFRTSTARPMTACPATHPAPALMERPRIARPVSSDSRLPPFSGVSSGVPPSTESNRRHHLHGPAGAASASTYHLNEEDIDPFAQSLASVHPATTGIHLRGDEGGGGGARRQVVRIQSSKAADPLPRLDAELERLQVEVEAEVAACRRQLARAMRSSAPANGGAPARPEGVPAPPLQAVSVPLR